MQIPKISNERLAELLARIRPVVRQDGEPWYIKPVDPRNIAYTWDPTPTKKATDLVPLKTVRTLHTYGYHGMFKPSIAECLAQMPDDVAETAVAFEIVDSPQTADDLNREREALNEGFHVAQTTFYSGPRIETADDDKPPTVWERLLGD